MNTTSASVQSLVPRSKKSPVKNWQAEGRREEETRRKGEGELKDREGRERRRKTRREREREGSKRKEVGEEGGGGTIVSRGVGRGGEGQ